MTIGSSSIDEIPESIFTLGQSNPRPVIHARARLIENNEPIRSTALRAFQPRPSTWVPFLRSPAPGITTRSLLLMTLS